jgi:hypothetical protein
MCYKTVSSFEFVSWVVIKYSNILEDCIDSISKMIGLFQVDA